MKKKSKRTSVVLRAAALTLAGLLSFQNTVYGSVDAGTTAETAAVDAWDGSIAEGFAGGEGTQDAHTRLQTVHSLPISHRRSIMAQNMKAAILC